MGSCCSSGNPNETDNEEQKVTQLERTNKPEATRNDDIKLDQNDSQVHVEEQRMSKDEVIFNIKVKGIKSDNETVNVGFILIIGNEEEARRL